MEKKTKFRIIAAIVAIISLVLIKNVDEIFHALKLGFIFETILGGIILSSLVISVLGLIRGTLKKFREKGILFFSFWGFCLGLIFGGLLTILGLLTSVEVLRFVLPFFLSLFVALVLGILSEMNKDETKNKTAI
ncbi:hypothetical protein SDC9_07843 [bioreactor metagenome]|uniref:Uncharacterized protein n=1 Tax=bioreactor metagenome TaxID=1076179 RepID=A0A644T5Y8_9ZZZZ|nr:hypothetical protein [Candidatus Elulimicrobiales bacterium]